MDNRRLYSAIAHGPATFEITAQAKFHHFSDELPESMRLPLLKRCFIWEAQGGCYRLDLAPLAWGTAILFRTVTQSPDFPLEGREDSPVIGPIRYPYFVLTPSFVKYQHMLMEKRIIGNHSFHRLLKPVLFIPALMILFGFSFDCF